MRLFGTRVDDLEEEACAAQRGGQAIDYVDDEKRGPGTESDFSASCPWRSALARLSASSARVALQTHFPALTAAMPIAVARWPFPAPDAPRAGQDSQDQAGYFIDACTTASFWTTRWVWRTRPSRPGRKAPASGSSGADSSGRQRPARRRMLHRERPLDRLPRLEDKPRRSRRTKKFATPPLAASAGRQ